MADDRFSPVEETLIRASLRESARQYYQRLQEEWDHDHNFLVISTTAMYLATISSVLGTSWISPYKKEILRIIQSAVAASCYDDREGYGDLVKKIQYLSGRL